MAGNNPRSLQKEMVVKALQAAGSRTITLESLNADIDEGAPVNEDGTIDIIAYAAWILKGNRYGD